MMMINNRMSMREIFFRIEDFVEIKFPLQANEKSSLLICIVKS